MAVDFDAKLTRLTAEILRDAVQVFDAADSERLLADFNAAWNTGMFGGIQATGSFTTVTGSFLAVTGSFPAATGAPAAPAATGSLSAAITGAFKALRETPEPEPLPTLAQVFRLPPRLPGVRLAPEPSLAALARSAPTMAGLDALARWLGRDGRPVTETDELTDGQAADACRRLGIRRRYLAYLWEYALTSGWFELVDSADGKRSWAVIGPAAWRWADGDDSGALHVWAAVFASVLATTLEVAAEQAPVAARKLNLAGQGVALAVLLFLARRTGLTTADARDLVREGAIGDRPASRARKRWDAWVREQGDPADRLLGELVALRAVALPARGEGNIVLTPLALWALRRQFALDGITVPVIHRTAGQQTAAHLVALADGISEAEFEAEFAAWMRQCGPDRAARELLAFAAFADAQSRLTAVNLVRRIGIPAHRAWKAAMQRPELRGYARIALSMMAGDLPESTLPLILDPDPDDLTWVATDLLTLAGGDEAPDPELIAAQFAEVVPPGDEAWIFGLMSRASHPDVIQFLDMLARHHPDRQVARDARKAARAAARNRGTSGAGRAPARAAGR